jgi:hypothetical protein
VGVAVVAAAEMTICRTIADVLAAADADSLSDPPLTQDQVDYAAGMIAPHLDAIRGAA